MPAAILSTNVGSPRPNGSKATPTGIQKLPVDALDVAAPGRRKGPSGVAGDFIGNGRHHGGDDQAVYAVAREELDWWATELGLELPNGHFGENLTTTGIDVDAAIIGSTWQVGSAILAVTGPRIPCSTFSTHMQQPRWVKRFAERGRTGAYFAVVAPGTISRGDAITVRDVPDHGITVPMTFRAWMGDRDEARRILDLGAGSALLREELAEMLARS
ncbi:MAG: MOSC domain-containing protein [Actinobacteria bacterium]|uniref:MOSC domain-containing protein n=1 Tax=Nostocoides veronense TaxID=330836 RepID=UPI0031DBD712|nr:MOSC domain-containing protein [Actinomycetota bacterium]